MLAVEPYRRTDGGAAFAVRGPSTAMVVDVYEPGRKDVPCAVDNFCVVSNVLTPAVAGPSREDPTIRESNEGVGTVEAWAD